MIERTRNNTALGTENTESVESVPFKGDIAPFARDKEEAVRIASQHIDDLGEMSFWMDS